MIKTYFNWSTGKDSALALHHLLKDEKFKVDQLLTSVNSAYDSVTMHGLRRSLMEAQINALGIPYNTIELPENPDMETYGKLMSDGVQKLKDQGYTVAGFGDIFLEDLRAYREKQLQTLGVECLFPLWKRDTTELMEEFLSLGFKAIVICTNGQLLDESFVGRELDASFLNDLPENVDPCGENGEFHTFCYDGPIFKKPILFNIGERTYREYPAPKEGKEKYGYWFCDLLPKE
ncbi:diphthine--ammonia ligase [Crocinitomicaceae bacterium]|nr:diphthine--ammonia ligase [Crocinitomicaceae bacterium]MDB3907817.1 diphthine--ammonia ligase [Crocinitomicaceae bacterium]